MANQPSVNLTKFAWMSIAAALITIVLKTGAWRVTGSVGLLSDALESIVNLVAAIVALIVLTIAGRAPDEEHAYGHAKAEYFSSGIEGVMIFLAAVGIFWSAIPRLLHPAGIDNAMIGLAVSFVSSAVNGFVAWRLFAAAKAHRSITLRADAQHLMTDIWTSAGVLIGIALVALTGWYRLDPIIALLVAANILWTGYKLVRESLSGLMDTALSAADQAQIDTVIRKYADQYGLETHALRTREAGSQRFIRFHVLVPGEWTVSRGHEILERMEREIESALPDSSVETHLEPIDDPLSYQDVTIVRQTSSMIAQDFAPETR